MNKPAPRLVELSSADRARRTAGITGTRALVHDLRFDALCAVLVECGAVPQQAMTGMLMEIASRLEACSHILHHGEFLTCPHELEYQAHRHRERAERLGAFQDRDDQARSGT